MLILFFDTFIISSLDKGGLYNLSHMEKALSQYRDEFPTYKWKNKIDIVKYTLTSYSHIEWDKVIIRYECEDEFETIPFYNFCKDIFPNPIIENQRSASANEYCKALFRLDNGQNPWIFFSPNNDHPYIGQPCELLKCLEIANELENKHPDKNVSVLYSHYTESMIDNRITDPQWGHYDSCFKKVIFENDRVIATISNKLTLDSVKIYRLNYLLSLFALSKVEGRLIRLEDTGFHMNYSKSMITVAPKVELCRHYDSYAHLMKWVPPLFIPTGFFESDIKVRYGYDDELAGWVTINPRKEMVSRKVDLVILLEDVYYFWSDRISHIDINPNFGNELSRTSINYYKNLLNPFHDRPLIINGSRSFIVWIGQILPWRNSYLLFVIFFWLKFLRNLVYNKKI